MIASLNAVDLVLLLILFFSVLAGVIRGLVRELLSLVFLLLALFLAFLLYARAGQALRGLVKPPAFAVVAGFFLVFGLVLAAGALLTWLIRRLLVRGPLRSADRVLGGLFGLLRGGLIGAVLVFAVLAGDRALPRHGPLPQLPRLVRESALAPHLLAALRWLSALQPGARPSKPLITL